MKKSRPRVRGLKAMEEALRVESFPIDKQGLYYAIGDLCLSTPRAEPIPVRDLLDGIEPERFESADDAIEAIRSRLEQLRPTRLAA